MLGPNNPTQLRRLPALVGINVHRGQHTTKAAINVDATVVAKVAD